MVLLLAECKLPDTDLWNGFIKLVGLYINTGKYLKYQRVYLNFENIIQFCLTGSVYFFTRKKELLKNTVNFQPHERYFTPVWNFFLVYSAGFLTGFIAGFVGMAAGLTMVVTMVQFKLIATVTGAIANYCYFLICIQVFINLLVDASKSQGLGNGEQFFFYALGVLAVLTFINYGHIIFYIDFAIVVLNIIGYIVWRIENGYRDGFRSLKQKAFNMQKL